MCIRAITVLNANSSAHWFDIAAARTAPLQSSVANRPAGNGVVFVERQITKVFFSARPTECTVCELD